MSFLGEIKRRKVFQVAAAYLVVAWLVMQVVDVVNEPLSLPGWFDTVAILLLGIGFPIAVILSWAFNITPAGVVRDPGASSTAPGGRKLEYATIGLLVIAVGWLLYRDITPGEVTNTAATVGAEVEAEVVATADRRSIAALPFANESAAEENAEFFANGIHDELLTQLAKIRDLKVISRTSVMEYRDTTKNVRQIGRELGVSSILEGRVQRAGDAVRINVQLIDADTDAHLWAETYNRALTAENIFAIQSEMATAIAGALEATLLPQEVALLNEIPTQSTRAYDFYLSGNEYYRDRNFILAAEMYQRAVDEDPRFAAAYAGLSKAHADIFWFGRDPGVSHRELALTAVERAFELAPNLPEAHLALANYYYHGERDYESALRELAIAEQGLPGDSDLHFTRGAIYRRQGLWDEALASFDRATELDPRHVQNLWDASLTLINLRNYDEAEQRLERIADIAPDFVEISLAISRIPLVRDGNATPYREALESEIQDGGTFGDVLTQWLSFLYERDYEAALAYLDGLSGDTVYRGRQVSLPKASAYGLIYRLLGNQELAERNYAIAREQVGRELAAAENIDAGTEASHYLALGEILAGLGRQAEAIEAARRAMAILPPSVDASSAPAVRLRAAVGILVPAGDYDAAIDELDGYLAGGVGYWTIEGLLPDPRLDPIRDDPRFMALVEKYRRN